MAYPQQPGFQYGPPMPYGYWGPKPPSKAAAAISALLFVACGVISGIIAGAGWVMAEAGGGGGITSDTRFIPKNVELFVATIGLRFDPESVGLGWPWPRLVTMVIAVLVGVLALALAAGADAARWLLGAIAGLVTAYYFYVLIYLFTHHAGEVSAMVIVTLIVWLAALVVVFLPPVSRGMRSYQRKWAVHVQGQPQQAGPYGQPGPYGQQY